MKSEELTALGLNEEQTRQVLALNGRDIEKHKNSVATLQTQVGELTTQLNTANAKLTGFDPEWKTKAQQAQQDADKRVQAIEFDYALKSALSAAKAKNTTAVKALLNMDGLKLADGSIIGLNEQLEKIKAENDYLFENDTPTPRFSASTQGISSNAADKKTQINDMLRSALGGKGGN